jgi:hypothetical protein
MVQLAQEEACGFPNVPVFEWVNQWCYHILQYKYFKINNKGNILLLLLESYLYLVIDSEFKDWLDEKGRVTSHDLNGSEGFLRAQEFSSKIKKKSLSLCLQATPFTNTYLHTWILMIICHHSHVIGANCLAPLQVYTTDSVYHSWWCCGDGLWKRKA